MDNNIKWITKNGVHIPLTNDYMNDKIRKTTLHQSFPEGSQEYNGYVITPEWKTKDLLGKEYYAFYSVYKPDKYDITTNIANWCHSVEEAKEYIDNMKSWGLL